MAEREWQAGDVAMVTDPVGGERVMVHIGHDPANRCWHGPEANGDLRCLLAGQEQSARPLAVIDPEDREQVERFTNVLDREFERRGWANQSTPDPDVVDAVQAALREFANSTPPKPPEPQGLGAVVEDADGRRWVRVEPFDSRNSIDVRAWRSRAPQAEPREFSWPNITVIRVLSEGVES